MGGGRGIRVAFVAALAVATTGIATSVTTTATVAVADAPQAATITISHDAMDKGFDSASRNITLAQGGTLSVYNGDDLDGGTEHTVTSDDFDANGQRLFNVIVGYGRTVTIPGVDKLAPGTYGFHCAYHQSTMRGTLTISGSGGGVQPAQVTFEQPLFIPPKKTTAKISISIKQANVRVMPHGPLTKMWTYGGTFPGPTIVRPAGQDTKVTFTDNLGTGPSLTVHFHGDHHSSADDGQPARYLIARGKSRTYDYPLKDAGKPERGAFEWYHDHRMNNTARDNYMGLQGMFIVNDGVDAKLKLPTGAYDVPLMVSERTLDANNQLTSLPGTSMLTKGSAAPPNDHTVGNTILVNGRFAPYYNVSAHKYRLRLLNTAPFTTYDFALSDGHPFVQVGTGNGLLPRPVVRQDILLGPAQRADVVVDFRGETGKQVVLETVPRVNAPAKGTGTPSAQLMQFRVGKAVSDATRVPSTLQAPPKITVPKKVSATWTVGLGGNATSGAYWTLNGKMFDPKKVALKVPLGATQMWELRNPTNVTHFIHLHEEQWHTVLRDGKAPPAWERGLEDTWKLDPGETVRVVGKFTDYKGVFMIHCHMLDHEDHGLMAQFAVVDPKTKALPSGYTYSPRIARPAVAHAVPASYVPQLLDYMCAPEPTDAPARATIA